VSDTGSIELAKANIARDFADLADWSDRYQYLIDLGRSMRPYPDHLRSPHHLLLGCQSKVWLAGELVRGRLHLYTDSESAVVAGLLAILVHIYSDNEPKAILLDDTTYFQSIGLDEFLSPHRANGLARMIDRIRLIAQHKG
jgi:cysteine desulfuration protein SufE